MPNKADLENPGYTPSRSELDEVLSSLVGADEATSKLAERALGRSGLPAAHAAIARLPRETKAGKIRLYRLVGRVAQTHPDRTLLESLVEGLADEANEVQRSAVVTLGKLSRANLQGLGVETKMLALLVVAEGPERRALIEALGKIGGSAADEALARIDPDTDFERQLLDKARLCLMRHLEQVSETDRVNFDVPLEDRFTLSVGFRRGLGRIVMEQLRPELRAEPDGPTRARVRNFRGPLSTCFRSRSALGAAIELPVERADSDSDQIDRILDVLTCEQVVRLLERLSSARPRLRFSLSGEGHRRAFLWALSERLHNVTTRLSANPRGALWEVKIELTDPARIFLEPNRYEDPRFTYRIADVSGASHPTIAAALAHVLGVEEDDVIWDPFVGSGLELIERGRLGPYKELIGTDTDPASLDAAQLNVQKAKLPGVRLLSLDARTPCPKRITGIVTNPPLGARHVRDGHLGELLLDFLTNARQCLAPGGRLVWLSPMPARTAEHARTLGFAVERGGIVDVSGLTPELQVFRVPRTSRSQWRS
jgi:hypothetical protein